MDKIDKSIELLEKIKEIYDSSCRQHLKEVLKQIKNELITLLEEHKKNYDLIYKNSVHEIDLFKLEGRVKKADSIFEKFIRKDEGLKLLEKFSIKDFSDIEMKKDEIIKYFYEYEDIMGIKIVTELSEDCKHMYMLVLEKHNEFEDKIIFKDIEPEIQPKKMQNGLDIYNIKGTYLKEYGFELQIKSKIYSAWGDLDHSIFYKNYNFNPVKNTAQLTMNHIGNMLMEIERHLYTIRHANNDYEDNAKKVRFIEELCRCFSNEIKEKFNANYRVDKLADILLYTYEDSIGDEYNRDNLDVASTNYYSLLVNNFNDDMCKEYKSFRDNSFDAIILENFFLRLIKSKEVINDTNYESNIIGYLNSIIKYIVQGFEEENEDDLNERGINIRKILKDILKYVSSIDLFINLNNYISLNEWIKQLLEDYEVNNDNKAEIIKLWIIALNDGLIDEYLSLKDTMNIYDIFIKVEENIKKIEDNDHLNIKLLSRCNRVITSAINDKIRRLENEE